MNQLRLISGTIVAAVMGLALMSAHRAAGEDKVDVAANELLRAYGLFDRQEYKAAAAAYGAFVRAHPNHAEIGKARNAMALCHYHLGQYDAAIEALIEVLKSPATAQRDQAMMLLGHCHLARKEYAKAIERFDELLAKHKDSSQAEAAQLNRVQALYLAGKIDLAATGARQFLAQHGQSGYRASALYIAALAEYTQKEYAAAEKTAGELLKAYPNWPQQYDAMLVLAQAMESQGKAEAAAEQYRAMLKVAPPARQAEARYSLGTALLKAGKADEAMRELAAVAKDSSSPHAGPARLHLGLAQVSAGRVPEARNALSEVVKQDASRAALARYWLAQCDMAERKFDAARATLTELAKLSPPPVDAAQLALDLAICAEGAGQFETAARAFAEFRQRHGKSAQAEAAAYHEAFCLHKLGQYERSRSACAAALGNEASPLANNAMELEAENLFLLGRYTDAAKVFASLSGKAGDEARKLRLAYRMGQCAYYAQDYAKAIELLRPIAAIKATKDSEDIAPAMLLLGDALLQADQAREAAEVLGRYAAVAKADRLEAQYKLALALLRSGDAPATEKAFAPLLKGDAASPWVQRGLLEYAQYQFSRQKRAQAGEPLTRLLAANPPDELAGSAMYLLGWVELESKRFEAAAKHFARMAEKYPAHPQAADALLQQGVAMKEAGQPQQALEVLYRYLKAHGGGREAEVARAQVAACLVMLKKPEEAVKTLAAMVGDAKTVGDGVLYDLAWAHRGLKDSAAAIAAYERLLKEYPQSPRAPAAMAELAVLLEDSGKANQAAAMLEKVLAGKDLDAQTAAVAQYRLASCRAKMGEPEKAMALYAQFAEKYPQHELAASALSQAGVAAIAAKRLDQALRCFAEALKRHPKDREVAAFCMLKLGEVQAEAADFAGSQKTYGEFLGNFPDDKHAYLAHFGLGWALENQKKYDEARKAYEKVISANNGPTAARAQFQIGETFFKEGRFEQAIPALLAVADVYAYPEWAARALLEVANASHHLKQVEKARKYYQEVVDKHGRLPEAAVARQRLKALGASQ